MAEAVRAARKARPRSRPKEKKKKSSEESQLQEPDDVFLPPVAEVSSQARKVQVEHPGEFTEIRLDDEVEDGKTVNDVCDIPQSSLPSANEGSLAVTVEPPTDAEEFKADPSREECRGDVEKRGKSKSDKPHSPVEAVASGSENSDLLSSTFHSSAAGSQTAVGFVQDKGTENAPDVENPLVRSSEKLPLSISQLSEKSKIRIQRSGLKPVYPDLSAELSYERPTVIAVKPLLHNERLYPELPAEPELVPFTREQLKIFEPCSWLENVDSYAEEFESVAHQDRHEFYELLLNYMRCRKQLLLAEAELQAMMTDCQNIKGRLWTFKEEQKTVQGVCADQCKVTGHHRYQTVELNESVLGELKKLFEAKAEHVHQTLALHSYTSVLSRLQVESYVYRLLSSSSLLRSVALQQQEQVSKQSENLSSDLGHLKECISVLFSFTRRVIEDPQFQSDLLMWLQRLVSVLQRIGCPGDHLFLFNHILRCPAGISEWAVPFIQIKVLDNPSGVFHFMQSLALLMSPVKNRVDFMCHMKPSERKSSSSSGKESGNWTLVDEGGEEDEDPETSWILLLEDDLISLLSQFPFHELFQHFLGFKSGGAYFPEKTTPQEMMKIFAFANSLVELLSVGLETFNRARYRQFVKRIGQLIKMTLCHVSDHWAQYVSSNKQYGSVVHPYSVEKLQLEFDELFFRAVLHVLKAKRLGVWLFMSEMPYGTLSSNMLWRLFFVMHCAESEHLEKLCSALQPADCKQRLKDPEHLQNFEKYLKSMNCSEEICLLTTFAQMAQTKRADVDEDFIKIIVLEIYEVSYVSISTRETFSKVGRELLGAIASIHTQIISVLLDRVRETIEKVGMVSLYLFKELPLYLWKPSSSEIALIRDWLLNYNLTTVENKLACIILEGLNWGFGEHQDALHLDPAVHSEAALMVLEAYQKYLSQKPYAGLLSESIKQVWFSWMVLNMESIFEEDSQLRRVVEGELVINALTPDQALKKAQTQLKLPIVPSLQRLMIYRWAHQALATPADHPLMPLIWQKFFLLYLHRPGPQYGLPVDGCIGRRFFQSAAHVNLLNEMKQRLIEVADFHHAASKALRVESPAEGSDRSPEKASCSPDYLTSPELHKELVRLCNVFVLWLEEESFQKGDTYIPSLPKQYDAHRLAKVMQNQQDLWMEYVNVELIHHEFQEALNLWLQVQLESHTTCAFAGQTDFTNPLSAKERIINNLKKFDIPKPLLPLQTMKAPVPVISSASLVSQKEAIQLMRMDFNVLQRHAKTAALWESQHVALNSEILDTLPKLYVNREEQITLHLECRGTSNKGCQGAALLTIQFEGKHKNEAVSQQLHALRKEVRQLQAEATKPPSLGVVEAAVHVENFITALINIYKVQPMPAIKKVGISLFFTLVEYVCDETQRNPPTRQFFTSCIEILGQVFISGTKSECKRLLQTILQNRRLCTLLSPYFTPVASPSEFVTLYEKVVAFLSEDNSDVVFMLLTKFDLTQWLSVAKPPLSERTKLLESIHLALNACGLEPEEDILMPFNIFCKHWTNLLQYQFPDHYSDFLRLFVQSSSEQLLSPDCWKASLKALGCGSPVTKQGSFKKSDSTESPVLQDAAKILLSAEQVRETMEWLSTSFCKLRLASMDFRTFGLFSKWSPYVAEVNTFLEYLIKRLIDTEVANLAQEPVGSNRILAALQSLYSIIAGLFKPWILVLDKEDASNQPCYPWLESDTPIASTMVSLFADCIKLLHESFKDKLLPSHHGALWLHLMHYCEYCTAPKMPEFILYTFHTEFRRLPWKEIHPDQILMEEFFKIERGSPKSCFLFLGYVLCEINWVSVLSDAWNPNPHPQTHNMIVCLLYMMVLLAKEEQLIGKEESPLINLLGQTSSLPWQLVGISSYQSIISYCNSHYPPSVILAKDAAAELIVKLLKISAGFGASSDSHIHLDATLKCRAYIRQVVQFLSTLEQSGKITLAVLEQEMSKLLDDVVIFNPPDMDLQTRHMALSSLFTETLMMMNNSSVTTAESLRGSLRKWIDSKVHGLLAMPLLTAACQSLASVRHMAETTEACITAYFNEDGPHHQDLGWGPILASLQVPELTMEEFLQECLSLGSYLTLYVYLLQCLNTNQTLTNEMKILLTISKWMEQVYPSSAKEEAKLFLWWHKAMQLSLIQMEQDDTVLIESVIRTLLSIQARQSQLAEERLTSGILGAIGLGRRSPLSPRFRVVARSLSAFLLVQIPAESQVRLKAGSEPKLSQKAQQALNALESMASNKQYMDYQEQLSQASQFIKHPEHCLRDGNNLLALLINTLYPEVHYLDSIR
ncbi:ectopic P granules protein 5 homolog isoform 4-T4 [Theristicus caerulescens]